MGKQIFISKPFIFALLVFTCLGFLAMKGKKKKFDEVVIIHTSYGEIHAILFDETPEHKANFLKLAREGYYDSTTFHRVIRDFMIQGGDPNTRDDDPNNDGAGGPDYTLPSEINPMFVHTRGAIAAARNENPEKRSGGSQFYIVQGKETSSEQLEKLVTRWEAAESSRKFQELIKREGNDSIKSRILELQRAHDYLGLQDLVLKSRPILEKEFGPFEDFSYSEEQISEYETMGGSPHLDRNYTVFGKVVRGMNIIDSIASVSVDRRDRPREKIFITVSLVKMKRKKIQKEYDYTYPGTKKKK